MDKLKLYIAPIIGLVLLLVWYFVIQPRLTDEQPVTDKTEQKAP